METGIVKLSDEFQANNTSPAGGVEAKIAHKRDETDFDRLRRIYDKYGFEYTGEVPNLELIV